MTADPTIGMLANAALERRLLLFIGAGASMSTSTGFPSGGQLAQEIGKEFGINSTPLPSLGAISEILEHKYGRMVLEDFLRNRFKSPSTESHVHKLLAQIPAEYIITTNFDNLMERSLKSNGDKHQVISNPQKLMKMRPDFKKVVKIHGCIDDNASEMIITEKDYYEKFLFSNNFFLEAIKILLLTHSCLFIGYSMEDVNFRHMYFDLRKRLGRDGVKGRFFSIQRSISQSLVAVWLERGINVIKGDQVIILEKLVERIGEVGFTVSNGVISTTKDTLIGRLSIEQIRDFESKNGEHEQRFIVIPTIVLNKSGIKNNDTVVIDVIRGNKKVIEYCTIFAKSPNDGVIDIPRVMQNSLKIETSPLEKIGDIKIRIRKFEEVSISFFKLADSESLFQLEKDYYDIHGESEAICAIRAREYNLLTNNGLYDYIRLSIDGHEYIIKCVKMIRNPGRALIGISYHLFGEISIKIIKGGEIIVSL